MQHDEHLSKLYRQGSREDPPMALDSVILSRANQAVGESEKRRIWNRMSWMIPVASAAVALITVSLLIQIRQEQPQATFSEPLQNAAPLEKSGTEKELTIEMQMQPKTLSLPARKAAIPAGIDAESPPKGSAQPDGTQKLEQRKLMGTAMMDAEPEDVISGEEAENLQPDQWLAKIRTLFRDGNSEEAKREIEAFRKVYPDYPVPKDILLSN